MTAAELRVGVIGAGFLAETRARCWSRVRGARLAAVASARPERARAYADRHGVAEVFEDAEALLASDAVDLVDLCVPNQSHRVLTERAAAAGRHVLCTKPLAAYAGQDLSADASDAEVASRAPRSQWAVAVRDAEAMVDAARSAGVQLFYGENWLCAPSFVRARGLLAHADTPLLEMRGWECHSGSHAAHARSWRATGGGALLRLGAHPIGAMLALKAAEGERLRGAAILPESVTAEVADCTRAARAADRPTAVASDWGEVENWGCLVIAFEDGSRAIATGSDNWLGGMDSRLELLAARARFECNLSPNDQLRAYAPEPEVFGDAYLMEKRDTGAGWSTPMVDEDWSSGHLGMCQAIADTLHGRTPDAPPGDGALGALVTKLVYAGYCSAAEGRRVRLDEWA